ncbi:MAG: hypothetical protein KGN84_02760 [Acidobacteriota bacterium]|nr:hypothetical protein [Acidobacteriota bacterium]
MLTAVLLAAQSVVSVRSGVLNDFEGAVFIDNQPVPRQPGKFPMLHEGSDLLTQDGRAELMLMPENYLRVGTNSAVRMLSSTFADTRLEILNGSTIFDSGNAPPSQPVTLTACGAQIRIETPTRLRIDSDAAEMHVEKGYATVTRNGGEPVKVEPDQVLSLTGASVVRRSQSFDEDDLDLWSQQRNRMILLSVAADQGIFDPGDPNYSGAYDPGDPSQNGWVGYIPAATIPPLTGSYPSVVGLNYGLYYGYDPFGYYPYGYAPLYGGRRGMGYGAAGLRTTYRSMPVYPYRPTFPGIGGIGSPRPIGGIRIGGSSGGIRMGGPRPVARPIAPIHAPVHR